MTTRLADIGLTRDQYHRYTWRGAEPLRPVTLLSVSQIIGVQDSLMGSGGLVKWGAGIAADYVLDQWEGASASGVYSDRGPVLPRDIVRNTAIAQTDKPASTGSSVHEQVRRMLHGEKIAPDQDTVFHLAQFAAFLAVERPEVFFAEEMVANLTLGYAGQFDVICRIRDKYSIVDFKTGKLKPSHRLQLAGYMTAEFMGRSGSTETIPIPEQIEAGYVLLLRPDGYDLVDMTPTEADIEHFRYLTGVYGKLKAWQKETAE